MRVAILDDDEKLCQLMSYWLQLEGHEVYYRTTGKAFQTLIATEPFDLQILDWNLPDSTGIAVLEQSRKLLGWKLPILFCTQRDEESDVVTALNAGADDYITKPISQGIFTARVNALVRRSEKEQTSQNDEIRLGDITLNKRNGSVLLKGEPIKLTGKEFDVARCLLDNFGKLVSREYLLQ